ncbi:Transmembrane anterior posterior transformation protein 1 [Bienertia sinuspersici]
MEKTSKELLQLEHKDLSSSLNESALLVCGKSKKSSEEGAKLEGKPFNAPLPKSQGKGKGKGKGKGRGWIRGKDLMLGVADLHTQEAMEAAEAAVAGNQRVVDLPHSSDSSSESESSSDDDDDDDENAGPSTGKSEKMQVDDSLPQQLESRTKNKRPKIIELP